MIRGETLVRILEANPVRLIKSFLERIALKKLFERFFEEIPC